MSEHRQYQIDAADAIVKSKPGRRVVFVAPTGSGKTHIAAAAIQRLAPLRCVFVAHRVEILLQTAAKLVAAGVDLLDIGMVSASVTDSFKPDARVQVCGIATLARRGLKRAPDFIFIDEAHHAAAKSYKALVSAYPHATVIGLTATPQRLDGKGLRDCFDEIVIAATTPCLIAAGHLMQPECYGSRGAAQKLLKQRMARVKSGRGGDFAQDALGRAMRQKGLIGNVVDEWERLGRNRKTVVFASGVAHSKALCARFKRAKVKAAHLDGSTKAHVRAEILADFKRGAIWVLCNADLLGEGWDEPSVKCVVMARPTKSLTVYLQQVGRSLRPYGTQSPILLDHADNVKRFDLPETERDWTLDGREKGASVAPLKTCPKCGLIVALTATECESCGYKWPRVETPEERNERLVKIEREAFAKRVHKVLKDRPEDARKLIEAYNAS